MSEQPDVIYHYPKGVGAGFHTREVLVLGPPFESPPPQPQTRKNKTVQSREFDSLPRCARRRLRAAKRSNRRKYRKRKRARLRLVRLQKAQKADLYKKKSNKRFFNKNNYSPHQSSNNRRTARTKKKKLDKNINEGLNEFPPSKVTDVRSLSVKESKSEEHGNIEVFVNYDCAPSRSIFVSSDLLVSDFRHRVCCSYNIEVCECAIRSGTHILRDKSGNGENLSLIDYNIGNGSNVFVKTAKLLGGSGRGYGGYRRFTKNRDKESRRSIPNDRDLFKFLEIPYHSQFAGENLYGHRKPIWDSVTEDEELFQKEYWTKLFHTVFPLEKDTWKYDEKRIRKGPIGFDKSDQFKIFAGLYTHFDKSQEIEASRLTIVKARHYNGFKKWENENNNGEYEVTGDDFQIGTFDNAVTTEISRIMGDAAQKSTSKTPNSFNLVNPYVRSICIYNMYIFIINRCDFSTLNRLDPTTQVRRFSIACDDQALKELVTWMKTLGRLFPSTVRLYISCLRAFFEREGFYDYIPPSSVVNDVVYAVFVNYLPRNVKRCPTLRNDDYFFILKHFDPFQAKDDDCIEAYEIGAPSGERSSSYPHLFHRYCDVIVSRLSDGEWHFHIILGFVYWKGQLMLQKPLLCHLREPRHQRFILSFIMRHIRKGNFVTNFEGILSMSPSSSKKMEWKKNISEESLLFGYQYNESFLVRMFSDRLKGVNRIFKKKYTSYAFRYRRITLPIMNQVIFNRGIDKTELTRMRKGGFHSDKSDSFEGYIDRGLTSSFRNNGFDVNGSSSMGERCWKVVIENIQVWEKQNNVEEFEMKKFNVPIHDSFLWFLISIDVGKFFEILDIYPLFFITDTKHLSKNFGKKVSKSEMQNFKIRMVDEFLKNQEVKNGINLRKKFADEILKYRQFCDRQTINRSTSRDTMENVQQSQKPILFFLSDALKSCVHGFKLAVFKIWEWSYIREMERTFRLLMKKFKDWVDVGNHFFELLERGETVVCYQCLVGGFFNCDVIVNQKGVDPCNECYEVGCGDYCTQVILEDIEGNFCELMFPLREIKEIINEKRELEFDTRIYKLLHEFAQWEIEYNNTQGNIDKAKEIRKRSEDGANFLTNLKSQKRTSNTADKVNEKVVEKSIIQINNKFSVHIENLRINVSNINHNQYFFMSTERGVHNDNENSIFNTDNGIKSEVSFLGKDESKGEKLSDMGFDPALIRSLIPVVENIIEDRKRKDLVGVNFQEGGIQIDGNRKRKHSVDVCLPNKCQKVHQNAQPSGTQVIMIVICIALDFHYIKQNPDSKKRFKFVQGASVIEIKNVVVEILTKAKHFENNGIIFQNNRYGLKFPTSDELLNDDMKVKEDVDMIFVSVFTTIIVSFDVGDVNIDNISLKVFIDELIGEIKKRIFDILSQKNEMKEFSCYYLSDEDDVRLIDSTEISNEVSVIFVEEKHGWGTFV